MARNHVNIHLGKDDSISGRIVNEQPVPPYAVIQIGVDPLYDASIFMEREQLEHLYQVCEILLKAGGWWDEDPPHLSDEELREIGAELVAVVKSRQGGVK